MFTSFVVAGLIALALLYSLLNHFTRPTLSRVRGPKSPSFTLGNLLELFQRPIGQADFAWQNRYGSVVRFKTVFGEDQLLVADPKALQKIFHVSAYDYPKSPSTRVMSRMLNGRGVAWAEREDHIRQRKILQPGFGGPELKAFLGVFKTCAESMCTKWMETIESSDEQKVVLNIPPWLSRATLDAIGQTAFGVRFSVIEDSEHPLAKEYNNMLSDVFGRPSTQQIFIQAASKYVPPRILEWITDHSSNPRLRRMRKINTVVARVAKELVAEKSEALLTGKENRDIFSLLIKANMDTEAKNKLTDEELIAQIRTLLFAGHETTANSLSWILLELARHPKIQSRLRDEIQRMEAAVRTRGDTQFTITDFDAMPYTTAVIKEGLRYHPVVPHAQRIALKDDIVPVSRPVTTESGEVIDQLVVPKGTRIVASIAAYNRNPEVWGEDAHEFNPERWLEGKTSAKKPVSVGVYSNLMSFLGGARACLGWRFAIIEIQAFLVEIVGRFEIGMTEQSERIVRAPSFVMIPMVEGELERGSQLPLAVSVATREEDELEKMLIGGGGITLVLDDSGAFWIPVGRTRR